MHRLNEIVEKLTPSQVKEVEDFAEFLASRQPAKESSKFVNVDALMGMCKGMGGEKSDKELTREAWDAVLDKLDR